MKKLLLIAICIVMAGCQYITTEPGYETVLIDKPWFIGHGGPREETQKPGRGIYWLSTDAVDVATTPVKYDEPLDHLSTADNNFINYSSYIVLQWRSPAHLVAAFGTEGWYKHNLQEQYRTIVRDVTKQYQMTPIMTDQATLVKVEEEIAERFRKHIAATGLNVDLVNVNMGKALPDKTVIDEMNNTAAQQQRRKTEGQRKLAEDARKDAEKSRAGADNAYREDMHLDAAQFIQLEAVKRYSEACGDNRCVIVQGSAPVLIGSGK